MKYHNNIKITTEEFIKKANKINGDRYDYSLVNYKNSKTRIKIICKIHGIFEQKPHSHLEGHNCKKCNIDYQRNNINELIIKANEIHNNKYDYSLVNYENKKKPVEIICPIHGVFKQSMDNHLDNKGCKLCGYGKIKNIKTKTNTQFINESIKVHGNKYDYSLCNYVNSYLNVEIICPIHGIFKQRPIVHLKGCECPKCGYKNASESKTSNTKEFIKKSNIIHNGLYNYNLVNYKNSKNKVNIICDKHGIFQQSPNSHLNGGGCPKCSTSRGELKVEKNLIDNDVVYYTQKTFDGCLDKGKLKFDFFLPDYNMCIEYDGKQHFEPVEQFGGLSDFKDRIRKDKIKNKYCKDNNIELLRIPYWKFNSIEKLLSEIYD